MKYCQFLLLAVLLVSCTGDYAREEIAREYFSIADLMESQIHQLVSKEARLQKVARFNGVEDTDVLVPDSSGWRTELQSIIDMDINKPVLRGRYVKTDGAIDQNSNLMIQELVNADNNHVGVNRIRIYYLNSISAVRKILIERKERNPLYHSRVNVTIEFDDDGREPIMTGYNMQGYQKMVFMDSSKFEIDGTIIL